MADSGDSRLYWLLPEVLQERQEVDEVDDAIGVEIAAFIESILAAREGPG